MSNPLFSMFGGMNQMPNNSMMQIVQQFMQFRQNFTGDPRQKIQELLNSGRVSQDQYNRAVQMAQQLQRMMGGKQQSEVWPVMDELMSTINVMNERLYNGVMRKLQ